MAVMPLVRLIVLSVSILFSVILLALSAHLHTSEKKLYANPEAFALVTLSASVLTLINSSVMIAVDITRRGVFTSMIIYELVSLYILSILFLAGGAMAADKLQIFSTVDCSKISDLFFDFYDGDLVKQAETSCHENNAIEAFAFLTWILLFGYATALLILSIIAASRRKPVWFTSVKEAVFFPPTTGPITAPPGQMSGTAPQYGTGGTPHMTGNAPAPGQNV
jgi:hypothetical protein